MDEARNYRAMNTTLRVGESFGAQLPETFNEELARIIEACVFEDEKS